MGGLFGSLPLQGTDIATRWDHLYLFLFYLSVVLFAIVIVPMIYFAIKYRARPGHKSSYITHNLGLEIAWYVIPTILVMAIFTWGWVVYHDMVTPPKNAMEIRVVGQRWSWTFQYEDGRMTTNQLFVPVDKPVRLLMTAPLNDVLHSFFVPDFRIKQDLVPGMFTSAWFHPKMIGQHQVFCAEYCGTGHSAMLAKVIVLDEAAWGDWKAGKEISLPPAVGVGSMVASVETAPVAATAPAADDMTAQGKKLTEMKGCIACHSDDGSKRIGPSYKGVFESKVELSDGTTVTADEVYIRESIEKPQAKIVKGYESLMMPSFAGQMTETELNAVIHYIKSVK